MRSNRQTARHLLVETRIRIGKTLSAERGHIRHGIDVDQLVLVLNGASDVAHFDHDSLRELPLDGEVDRVGAILLEFRIEQRAVARGGTTIDAGEVRLRKSRRQRQYGCAQAVGADTENSVGIDAALPGALAGPARSDALHNLSDSDSVGGNSGHPDALRA